MEVTYTFTIIGLKLGKHELVVGLDSEKAQGDVTFSLAITPSPDREMFSGSVDADFVLALPFHHRDLQPDCVRVSTREGGGRA